MNASEQQVVAVLSSNRRKGRAFGAIGVVAVSVVALIACSDKDQDRLDTLRGDALVAVPLEGVASERVTESPGDSGGPKPTPSRIRRTFILDSGPIQPALDQIAAAARAAGWMLTPRDAVGYDGRKDIDGIDAWLVIAGLEAEKTVWLQIFSSD